MPAVGEQIKVRAGMRPAEKYTRLAAHLLRYGISQTWLSEKANIHRRTIGLYVKGLRVPTRPHVSRITAALGIPSEWLLDSRPRCELRIRICSNDGSHQDLE